MRYPTTSVNMRVYGLCELFRRAGMSSADWASCEVAFSKSAIEVRLGWDSLKRIEFPIFPENSTSFGTARLDGWMAPPAGKLRESVPCFILPNHPDPVPQGPLFKQVDNNTIYCKTDLPLIALAVLCRWEEEQSSARDQHGRFPARESVALQEGFLQRPIVDEYGLALEQAIKALSPGWKPLPRELRIKLSHDADTVGIPFSFRTAIGDTIRRGRPLDTISWFLSLGLKTDAPPLTALDRIVQLSLDRGLDSAVYWMAAKPTSFDIGYSLRDSRIQKRIGRFRERNVEMGIHPSYFSFGDLNLLRNEVNEHRAALGEYPIGGRQHYLRWLPETWRDWERAGLSYDSSVGYADSIGFRAGTCIPFRPWSLPDDRPLNLIEIPLLVMDCSLVHANYMGLKKKEALAAVASLAERCRMVGGVFTFLCHNQMLIDPVFGEKFYLSLVDAIGTGSKFDWLGELLQQMQVTQPAVFTGTPAG